MAIEMTLRVNCRIENSNAMLLNYTMGSFDLMGYRSYYNQFGKSSIFVSKRLFFIKPIAEFEMERIIAV